MSSSGSAIRMVDPYDPAATTAYRLRRDRLGRDMTEEIMEDPEELALTRKALRHVNDGDLRPRLGNT